MKKDTVSVHSPLGWLKLDAKGEELVSVSFGRSTNQTTQNTALQRAIEQIQEYFSGLRKHFSLSFKFQGTKFEQKVWQALMEIPYGEVRTYGDLAKQIGHPRSARAVGNALGKNQIPVILPCHRVVAGKGMGGFTGGLKKKKWLIGHEKRTLSTARAS